MFYYFIPENAAELFLRMKNFLTSKLANTVSIFYLFRDIHILFVSRYFNL